jgi:hypothetical protein
MVSRGRGLPRCVPFGYDLGVNICSQVDLLVVHAYCLQ